MVLLSAGMAVTAAPATGSIMSAVPLAKAGVGLGRQRHDPRARRRARHRRVRQHRQLGLPREHRPRRPRAVAGGRRRGRGVGRRGGGVAAQARRRRRGGDRRAGGHRLHRRLQRRRRWSRWRSPWSSAARRGPRRSPAPRSARPASVSVAGRVVLGRRAARQNDVVREAAAHAGARSRGSSAPAGSCSTPPSPCSSSGATAR